MSNKRHAYLIIAHNQFELLNTLLKSLDYELNDIYLHIDKKVGSIDFQQFYDAVCNSNLYILEDRINVQWGGYSQIECEMKLLEKAIPNGYQYYHLMSGVDLPIKSQKEIHDFFSKNDGIEFVHFDAEKISEEAYKRVSKYYFFKGRGKNVFEIIANKIILRLQFFVDRGKKSGLVYEKGANWFSITNELARYIVSNKKIVEENFKYTICCDEMFIQTMIASSNFIDKVSLNNFKNNYETILYCIDWRRGTPYEYTIHDYEELMNSNMLFARKFNWNKDKEIILKIYEKVMK